MARLTASFGLLSLWLAFLLMGWTAGGAVYLLLLAAVFAFPWRAVRAEGPSEPDPDAAAGVSSDHDALG